MEPIAIVRRRSRVWVLMIALIIAAMLIAAALWFMGEGATTTASNTVPVSTSSVIQSPPVTGNQ